jgi:hypothetical protein
MRAGSRKRSKRARDAAVGPPGLEPLRTPAQDLAKSREIRRPVSRERAVSAPADYLAAIAFFDANAEYAARLLGAARRAMGVFRSWRGHDAGPLYLYLRGRCHDALGREAAERLRGEGLASDPAAVLAEARRGLALA